MIYLYILLLAFGQNVSFSMLSRARNRDNMYYHAICSVGSNGIWFATMHLLVTRDLDWLMAIPYITGTVLGSLFGAMVSIRIEAFINAKT